jgi:hypothetical protein
MVRMMIRSRLVVLSLACLLLAAFAGRARLSAQTPPQVPPAQTPSQTQPVTPAAPTIDAAELDKIKEALAQSPPLNLDGRQLRFYVLVYAKQPRFADFVGKFDLKNGPVPRAGMTHQDFLNLVTPKELYASSGGITPFESLQFAITNWAAQAIIKRGLQEIRDARSEREVQAIRERIDKELAALIGKSPS